MSELQKYLNAIPDRRAGTHLRNLLLKFIDDDVRLNFTNMPIDSANGTSGALWKAGTSSVPLVCDTADSKFLSIYTDCGATSGDSRGMYLRHYITGAGGGGEAARIYTTISNVAAATAHGAHISLSFGTSGTVTGQGIAARCTLHIPSTALTSNVTMAAVQAEIYSDAATSDPGGSTLLSCFRALNAGNATGMADVDDDCALMELVGWTSATGNMVYAHTITTPGSAAVSFKVRVAGTYYYLYGWSTEGAT